MGPELGQTIAEVSIGVGIVFLTTVTTVARIVGKGKADQQPRPDTFTADQPDQVRGSNVVDFRPSRRNPQ